MRLTRASIWLSAALGLAILTGYRLGTGAL